MKKVKQVEKAEAELPVSNKPRKKYRGKLALVLFLLLLAGGGYYIRENPRVIRQAREALLANPEQERLIAGLEREASLLREEISRLKSAMAQSSSNVNTVLNDTVQGLEAQYKTMEKYNTSIIDSKADTALVLGLITRMDKAEERLDGLAKVSDDGALILSTAMLIKDKADKGESFALEAEILSLLGEGKVRLKPAIEAVAASGGGIETDLALVNEFNSLYEKVVEAREVISDETWQERIRQKLKEFFRIKRRGEADVEVKDSLQLAREYADGRKFYLAAREVEKSGAAGFEAWVGKVRRRLAFDHAVEALTVQSVAMMKVNSLKSPAHDE